MPAPLVRIIPPGGVPGERVQLTHVANGRTVWLGDAISDVNSDSATVQAWTAATQAAGRVPTRFPSGVLQGLLASRRKVADPVTGWDYQLAPANVLAADDWTSFQSYLTIQAGAVAGALEAASKALLAAPADFLSYVTGIPKWLLWLGGAAIVVGIAAAVVPRYLPAPRRSGGRAT